VTDETRPAASAAERVPQPTPKDYVLLPVLFYVTARLAVVLSVMPEGMGILWPPNGVLLAYLIRFGRRSYLQFGALALLAELALDIPKYRFSDAVLFGVANVAEATVAAVLLARSQFNPRFAHISDLVKFVVAAPVTAAFIGAVLGALVYSRMPGSDTVYFQFLRIWWFGDALGLMIVTPFFLIAWTHTRNLAGSMPSLRLGDAMVALGGLCVVALLLAARQGTLMGTHVGPVLLLPFAIFVAVRFGSSAAALAVSAITLFILVLTTQGRNPFGADAPRDAVIHAQEFVFVLSVMTLGIGTLLSRVYASQADLEVANLELRRRADALTASHREMERAQTEVVTLNEELERRVRERTRELEEALGQVKQLHGLLPICAWCKRVRDDHDYWHSVEEYISDRTDAQFSHGICPDCAKDVDTSPPPREVRGG
jgi:integral membrane sensor domain MASE1